MAYGDIEKIEKAMSGTLWNFLYEEEDPALFILIGSGYGIETEAEDIAGYYCTIRDFRRDFDYRLEAWRQAEKRQDGKLKVNNTLDKKLNKKFNAWLSMIELEKSIMRIISDDRGFNHPDFTYDEIKVIRKMVEHSGFELRTALRPNETIYYFRPDHDLYPDLNYCVPIIGFSVTNCLDEFMYQINHFDVEREVKASMIEKYNNDDTTYILAEKIREQAEKVPLLLGELIYTFTNYRREQMYGTGTEDDNDK